MSRRSRETRLKALEAAVAAMYRTGTDPFIDGLVAVGAAPETIVAAMATFEHLPPTTTLERP